MKTLALLTFIISGQVLAGNGTLMATCKGSIQGNEIKVNTYVDPSIFCVENPGPSKGFLFLEDGAISSVADATVTYGPEYSVETEDGIKVIFDSMTVPSTVSASMTGLTGEPVKLTCDTIEYHVSCE